MHISSSYAKILGQKLFRTREFPRSGSKAKDGEKEEEERKKERLNDGNNNGRATHGARKHAWSTQAAWANINDYPTITICHILSQYQLSYFTKLVIYTGSGIEAESERKEREGTNNRQSHSYSGKPPKILSVTLPTGQETKIKWHNLTFFIFERLGPGTNTNTQVQRRSLG